ncbi:MAG: DUF4412 domain-containing protein [Myxococcota bacterium]
MRFPRSALFAAFAVLWAAASARADDTQGWTALQHHYDPQGKEVGTSQLTYGAHTLRIDSQGRTMVIELTTGTMSIFDDESRSFTRITVEEMIAIRDRMKAELEKQMESLPAEMKAELQAQLETQEEAARAPLKATRTSETDTVHGLSCRIYTWRRPEGPGQACIAVDVPADVDAFRRDLVTLSERMAKVAASGAADSMAFLQLGEYGFPLRTKQQVELGNESVEVVTTFSDIESKAVDITFFAPPADYTQRSAEDMMQSMLRRNAP